MMTLILMVVKLIDNEKGRVGDFDGDLPTRSAGVLYKTHKREHLKSLEVRGL